MRRFLRSPLLHNSTLRLAKVGFIGMTEILMPIAIRVSLRGYTTLVYSDENSGLVDDLKEGGIKIKSL